LDHKYNSKLASKDDSNQFLNLPQLRLELFYAPSEVGLGIAALATHDFDAGGRHLSCKGKGVLTHEYVKKMTAGMGIRDAFLFQAL
jgi:hypothetical protein